MIIKKTKNNLINAKKYNKLIKINILALINTWQINNRQKRNIWQIIKLVNKEYLFKYHFNLILIYTLKFNKNLDLNLIKLISKYIVFEALNFKIFFYKKKYKFTKLSTTINNSVDWKNYCADLPNKWFNNSFPNDQEKILQIIDPLINNIEIKKEKLENLKVLVVNGVGFFYNLIFTDIKNSLNVEWLVFLVCYFLLIIFHNNYYYYFVNENNGIGLINLNNEYKFCQSILKILKYLQQNCKAIFKIKFNIAIRIINKNLRLI